MRYLLIMFAISLPFLANAQRNPELDDMKLKKKAVKQVVLDFFEGFHEGDTTKMKMVMHKDMIMQTIYKTKEGEDVLNQDDTSKFLNAIAGRPVGQRWNEQLLLFKIEVEDYMAHVWTPYEFYLNDQFSHCGVNSFQLFKDNGAWKIIYLVDTRRRAGCKD
ncbi:nuclear transport factor 2 family protein [Sungkyunkwania multivorans]|uniref:Nuclear transport factor 2 family protein n=1 Tax=Sungkyunkwania multivorans TaxID=1173618 RepID=A0ABW3CXV1_9FLAO